MKQGFPFSAFRSIVLLQNTKEEQHMKRLGTLVMAIILITGCNAMQPNMEETELLWAETEKNIQKWGISTKSEISPAVKPRNTPETTVEILQ